MSVIKDEHKQIAPFQRMIKIFHLKMLLIKIKINRFDFENYC